MLSPRPSPPSAPPRRLGRWRSSRVLRASLAVGLLLAGATVAVVPVVARDANAVIWGADSRANYFIAALLNRGTNEFICTATIISDDFALTARHCLEPSVELDLIFGALDRTRPEARKASVASVAAHPTADLALLWTDTGGLYVNPRGASRLSDAPPSAVGALLGGEAFLAGFGATQENGPSSPVLRHANVEIKEFEPDAYNGSGLMVAPAAPGPHKTPGLSYLGDSGGPLVDSGTGTIVGIGSMVNPKNLSATYTQIAPARDWIRTMAAV